MALCREMLEMVQGPLFRASEMMQMRCLAKAMPRSHLYKYVLQTPCAR